MGPAYCLWAEGAVDRPPSENGPAVCTGTDSRVRRRAIGKLDCEVSWVHPGLQACHTHLDRYPELARWCSTEHMGMNVRQSRGAGPRQCLQWPLKWPVCWPEAGRRGLGSGVMSPGLVGSGGRVLSSPPSWPARAAPARPAGPGSPAGHPGDGRCPVRAGPACGSAGPHDSTGLPWA